MTFTEINKRVKAIKELIKKVKFEDALSELENFIEEIGDKELDKEIVALTARYNADKKAGRLGVKDNYKNQNEIIYAMTEVLSEAKEMAVDKTTPKEDEELKKANEIKSKKLGSLSPKLLVTFDNQQQLGKYKISQTSQSRDDFVATEMLKIRNEYPRKKLKVEIERERELAKLQAKDDAIDKLGINPKLLHVIDNFKPFKDMEKDKERYNSELLTFFFDYEGYLNRLFEYKLQKSLTIEVNLLLVNNGTLPAKDIDIHFHFPDGFELYDEESYPKKPVAPDAPYEPTSAFNMTIPLTPNIDFSRISNNYNVTKPNVSSLSIKKTNSYDVDTHVERLKHNKSETLHKMYVIFDKYESVIDFCVDYELRCANIPNIVRDKLDFAIEKSNN